MPLLHRHHCRLSTLTRNLTSSPFSTLTRKIPLLYKPKPSAPPTQTTPSRPPIGRGASGQLGGCVEELHLYSAPLAPVPGRLGPAGGNARDALEVGISCGLFHSSLVGGGKLWMWGKGDGGRLGFGHENSLFDPALYPNVDSLQSVAMGGLHSIALASQGQLFSWGYGGFGALGHFRFVRELFPKLVDGSWKSKIRHFATGGAHTAAITESGVEITELLKLPFGIRPIRIVYTELLKIAYILA